MLVVYNRYDQFEEIAQIITTALTHYQIPFVKVKNVDMSDPRLHILFGANVWTDLPYLPPRYIIVQLEQSPIKKWFNPQYFARLAQAEEVWEYNLQNIDYFRTKGLVVRHVPIAYIPAFDPLPSYTPPQDIDILFLGQLNNDHRKALLARLRASGLAVHATNNSFGDDKKKLVARAKVVLNIHYGYEALFEEARVVPLLAMGKVVVSESVSDQRYQQLYSPYVHFARDPDHFIALCQEWINASPERRTLHGIKVREWVTTDRHYQHLLQRLLPIENLISNHPSTTSDD